MNENYNEKQDMKWKKEASQQTENAKKEETWIIQLKVKIPKAADNK